MTRPLTVVQLLPALDSGGVERGTLEVAKGLVDSGHRARVISAGGAMVEALRECGAEHIQMPIGRKNPLVFRHVRALTQVIADADIVHARSRLPAWLGRLALRRLPIERRPAWVTTVHGLNSVSRYSAVMTTGDRVICVSRTVMDFVRDRYPQADAQRLRVVPRGVDRAFWSNGFAPSPQWRQQFEVEFPGLGQGALLCLPGRLTRLKGHESLLKLLAMLKTAECPVRAIIVGGGGRRDDQARTRLTAQARELGIEDQVVFSGPRSDVREIMAVSDLVLSLSSKPEAFGRTVLEALSLGRPVVGFDYGGVGELLRDLYPQGCVPPGDTQALCRCVSRLLVDAPPVPHEHSYTLEAMLGGVFGVYREVTGGRS